MECSIVLSIVCYFEILTVFDQCGETACMNCSKSFETATYLRHDGNILPEVEVCCVTTAVGFINMSVNWLLFSCINALVIIVFDKQHESGLSDKNSLKHVFFNGLHT